MLKACQSVTSGTEAEIIFGAPILLTWALDLAALGALVAAWLPGVTPPALMVSCGVVLVAFPATLVSDVYTL